MKLRRGLVDLAIAMGCTALAGAAEESTAARALQLANEAAAAVNDGAIRLAKLEAAVALRPDFAQLLLELAEAQTAAGQADAAVGTLARFADLGLHAAVERAEPLAGLRSRADFQAIVRRLAANLHPQGRGEIAFVLRDITGLIEGIAWRAKTNTFYFADVHARCVWRRDPDGALRRLADGGGELLGVFALAVDEAGGAIWAATAAGPAMRGFTGEHEGAAALVEIDLASGATRRTFDVERTPGQPRAHSFRALAVADDGGVVVLDRDGRRLWQLAPGASALTVAAESAEFFAPHGLALLPGGVAMVADQVNGLLRVDLARGEVRRIESPDKVTLADLTCLVRAPDGALLAAQAGLRPNRLLRIELEGAEFISRVTVLESGHPALSAPALGCIGAGGDLFLIGNAGWSRFERGDGRPSAPRPVPVFRTRAGGAQR